MATKLCDDSRYSGRGLFQQFGTLEAGTRFQGVLDSFCDDKAGGYAEERRPTSH